MLNGVMINMDEAKKVNIQSTAGTMHHLFGRISYKPWYAIAEFVDNSTQSFFSNEDKFEDIDHVKIDIQYDRNKRELTVTDNAYGMDLEELENALNVEGNLYKRVGRNEFGAGLKTAAGWFGEKWSITTVKYKSGLRYTAVVDIENLENEITIYVEPSSVDEHGTIVKIEKMTKPLTGARTIGKIKELLSSMYRRDIKSGKVELRYNSEVISFEDYPVLRSFRGKNWKKEVDFEFDFNEKRYHIDGFVAIMDPGSFPKAGFALFRRDRVIIGGTDLNYKPTEIFTQPQSQRSLKLYGELNMDDFPVNQAKDGFVWDDGLEEEFIKKLKENIQDYISIADISKKARANEEMYSSEASRRVGENVRSKVEDILVSGCDSYSEQHNADSEEEEPTNCIVEEPTEYNANQKALTVGEEQKHTVDDFLEDQQERNSDEEEKIVGSTRHYEIPLNNVRSLKLSVDWTIHNNRYWIDIQQSDMDNLIININIDHPFFRPYSNQEEFKVVLEKFVIAFVIAEVMSKMNSDKEGYIYYKAIRDKMNDYLRKLGED